MDMLDSGDIPVVAIHLEPFDICLTYKRYLNANDVREL